MEAFFFFFLSFFRSSLSDCTTKPQHPLLTLMRQAMALGKERAFISASARCTDDSIFLENHSRWGPTVTGMVAEIERGKNPSCIVTDSV